MPYVGTASLHFRPAHPDPGRPSELPERKSYLPSSSMDQPPLSMPAADQQAGMRTMPHLPPFPPRGDPYGGMGMYAHAPPPPPPPPPPAHHPSLLSPNPRKRRGSEAGTPPALHPLPSAHSNMYMESRYPSQSHMEASPPASAMARKKTRTNTPWTPAEEQRLKAMRDAGQSWGEIAKTFPLRTEGSVKKHWYKDMHYAEFAEDESTALLNAIKEYEANKWKVIGQKVGKPAKACEQYAKEHFGIKG